MQDCNARIASGGALWDPATLVDDGPWGRRAPTYCIPDEIDRQSDRPGCRPVESTGPTLVLPVAGKGKVRYDEHGRLTGFVGMPVDVAWLVREGDEAAGIAFPEEIREAFTRPVLAVTGFSRNPGHETCVARHTQIRLQGEAMNRSPMIKTAAGVVCMTFALVAGAQDTGTSAPAASSESASQHVDDATITTKVKAELLGAKNVKSGHIHVKTVKGVVWLTGTVPSTADRDNAKEVVEGVSGVTSVKSRLKVAAE